jgi:hypothetical protein
MEANKQRVTPVPPGQGKTFWVAGEMVMIKARSKNTGGAY